MANEYYYNHQRPEILSRVPTNPRRVLDVGCGAGKVGSAIKDQYRDSLVVGIEYQPEQAKLASERLDEVWQINLNEVSAHDINGNFDVIICADVIEHLIDPFSLMRTLRSRIDRDGVAILSIPNIRHWSVLVPLLSNDLFTYTDQGLLDRTHVHFFTYTEIDKMLQECGWSIYNTNIVRIKMTEDIEKKLMKAACSFGADPNYTKTTLEAYQYIIDAKPV